MIKMEVAEAVTTLKDDSGPGAVCVCMCACM